MSEEKVKILVVDDSVIYRKGISRILDAIDGFEVVGQARDGKEAVELFKIHNPDIVTLDVEMPVMDGLETLKAIKKIKREAKVIMISSVTALGAQSTIEALRNGALDYLTKSSSLSMTEAREDFENRVREKMAMILLAFPRFRDLAKNIPLAAPSSGGTSPTQAPPSLSGSTATGSNTSSSFSRPRPVSVSGLATAAELSKKIYRPTQISLFLIGCSTGGPQTLHEVFKQLAPNRSYATVIVQHMPPLFTAQLASSLARSSGHKVEEAYEGLFLSSGSVVIAPGGKHLELEKKDRGWICHITDGAPVNSCKPSVDVTFNSVAKVLRSPEVVACVLTGMGADGAQGSKSLYEKNIPIITQTAESCVVYGMPKMVDELGIACRHVTPEQLISTAESFMLFSAQL